MSENTSNLTHFVKSIPTPGSRPDMTDIHATADGKLSPRVLVAILTQRKSPVSPFYLACLEALDYEKKSIVLYIRADLGSDDSSDIIARWVEGVKDLYRYVDFNHRGSSEPLPGSAIHESNSTAAIRQDSLQKVVKYDCDYYFVADIGNYLKPGTLKSLLEAHLPITSPLLRDVDPSSRYSNFHEKTDASGYFKQSTEYDWLLYQKVKGFCQVDVVHGTYLIRRDVIKYLRYDDGSRRHDYVIFSDSARKSNVPQYLDTRQVYGYISMEETSTPAEGLIYTDILAQGVWYGRAFWAGQHDSKGAVTASANIYDMHQDFRVPSHMHQSFDTVLITDRDLGQIKQWPLVIDEALRLLVPGGLLIVRFSGSKFLNGRVLATELKNWTRGNITLEFQQPGDGNSLVWGFRLTTTEIRPLSLASYTFGVITDGTRADLLARFIESVHQIDGLDKIDYEVIVCGPANSLDGIDTGHKNLRLIEQPPKFLKQGWITRKKNLIVDHAKGENLVIAHTRYTINPDFLTNMMTFGADFDVIAPRQVTADGRRYLDWVTTGPESAVTGVGVMVYGDYNPSMYVNGGIIIAKRSVLLETPWNDLLLWNQAEDVELTRRLTARGVVPRLARQVVVSTHETRPGLLPYFQDLPWQENEYVDPV